jgi:hypothetical protein
MYERVYAYHHLVTWWCWGLFAGGSGHFLTRGCRHVTAHVFTWWRWHVAAHVVTWRRHFTAHLLAWRGWHIASHHVVTRWSVGTTLCTLIEALIAFVSLISFISISGVQIGWHLWLPHRVLSLHVADALIL